EQARVADRVVAPVPLIDLDVEAPGERQRPLLTAPITRENVVRHSTGRNLRQRSRPALSLPGELRPKHRRQLVSVAIHASTRNTNTSRATTKITSHAHVGRWPTCYGPSW